jgi:phosphoribosylamine--glycine ligase
MRVLVVGSGGREHALAWKLAQSPSVETLYAAPGNPGMARVGACVPIAVDDLPGLVAFAETERIDLTVVGPEVPLVAGIADAFSARDLRLFGPTAAAAHIEGSKVFCRELAARQKVPMARGERFADPEPAMRFARSITPPVVVKADGLAAGKGVLICRDHEAARQALDHIMIDRVFGAAGERVVVEEFLQGRETSLFCITDGKATAVLEPAQDYKRALDDDKGLNTGGMGSYSPVPWLEADVRRQAVATIVEPLLDGLAAEGRRYAGCFYAGLMITQSGPRLIEVNCRFGDPETQVLLPRLASDLAEILLACASGSLEDQKILWRDEACVSVVVAAPGYPGDYPKGLAVEGIDEAEDADGVAVFHAGTVIQDGKLRSASGRVLNVSALGASIPDARRRAYEAVGRIRMDGKHFRTDIAADVT